MINAICHLCKTPVWDIPEDHPATVLCDECQKEPRDQLGKLSTEALKECLLKRARELGALKRGEYTLRNGSMTDTYFDGRILTMDPYGATLIGRLLLPLVNEAGADAVGGPVASAIPIATAISMRSWSESLSSPSQKPLPAFAVRQEPKDHGAKRQIDGPLPRRSRVAIVDDTMTTGRSIQDAMTALRQEDHHICAVIVLVDRGEKYEEADLIRKWGQGFTSIMDIEEVRQPLGT